jgi:streptomycin 6-kinase
VRAVPEYVRLKAESQGDEGRRWVAGIDRLIEQLEREWELVIGVPYETATEAFVAPASGPDGAQCVVKVAAPGVDVATEARVLARADGVGYARLLRYDAEHRALALEQLGPSLFELDLPVEKQIEIVCATLARSWEAPPDPGLETGAAKARRLGEMISDRWHRLDRPCSQRVLDEALRFAAERAAAFDPDTSVLVHGDAQSFNTLRASDGSFKLVDPDGLFAEREYDVAVQLREWNDDAGRERTAFVAGLTGLDEEAIWQWAFVERVSTSLFCLDVGMADAGTAMLAVAEDWLSD